MRELDGIILTSGRVNSGPGRKRRLKGYSAKTAAFARKLLYILWIGTILVTLLSILPLIFSSLGRYIMAAIAVAILFFDFIRYR